MEVISCSLLLEHYWNRFFCCNWIRHLAARTDVTYFLLFSIRYSSGGLVDFGDCREETELTGHEEAGWRCLVKFLLYTLFLNKKKSLRNTSVLSAAFFLVLNHIRARLFKYLLIFIAAKLMTLSLDFLFWTNNTSIVLWVDGVWVQVRYTTGRLRGTTGKKLME